MSFPSVAEQLEVIRRGALDIIPEPELVRKLERSYRDGVPLRVKQGFDPTRPDLHIGHAVSIRKLRDFQELGHEVIFVVGDYTAMVGDPTGRSELRPQLSAEEIREHARTYADQVFQILDPARTRVEYNSTWLAPLRLEDVLRLTAHYTVARMLEREDFANRERLARLLRFASTTSDTQSVALADYKARMKEGQEAIYYITADTLAAARSSPQLEVFRKKGIEVLLMTDRVDEWALSYLHEFDCTPLQSVAKVAVDLGKLQDEAEKKAAEEAAEAFKPVLEKLKEALKDKAQDVRATTRLVDSPACLVVSDSGMSMQLARMLKQAGQPVPEVKPVLEVNAGHPLVRKLDGSAHFDDLAHILFDQALLAEGGLPEDPAAYVKRVNALLA